MKFLIKISITVFLILSVFVSNSQQTETDIVKNGDADNQIKISETGMYKGTDSEKAKKYFVKAGDYASNHDFTNAKKYYLKAVKEDKNYVEAYDNLGLMCRRLGKINEAIEYYKKSIELYPSGITAHQNLASAYAILKDFDKALAEYKKIAQISPENPESYYGTANIYLSISEFDKALENSKKAVELYKKSNSNLLGDGYYLTGLIYYYKGEKENAKKYFTQAKNNGVKLHHQIEKELFENKNEIELKTKEDYINSEDKFIEYYDWLLNTPFNSGESRKEKNAFIIKWVSGCPYINIDISKKIVKYNECVDCLIIFIGGRVKYAIETKDYYDKFKGNLEGTKDVIFFYKRNKSTIGKNKHIEKLIKLQEEGKLEKFIKSNTK